MRAAHDDDDDYDDGERYDRRREDLRESRDPRSREMSRIRVGAVKSDVYTNARESGRGGRASGTSERAEERRAASRLPRGSRARASSDAQGRHSLGRCIFARLLPTSPPFLPLPGVLLLPPTRRVVSHALYLEARREERAYPARARAHSYRFASLRHRKNMSRSSLYPRPAAG